MPGCSSRRCTPCVGSGGEGVGRPVIVEVGRHFLTVDLDNGASPGRRSKKERLTVRTISTSDPASCATRLGTARWMYRREPVIPLFPTTTRSKSPACLEICTAGLPLATIRSIPSRSSRAAVSRERCHRSARHRRRSRRPRHRAPVPGRATVAGRLVGGEGTISGEKSLAVVPGWGRRSSRPGCRLVSDVPPGWGCHRG